MSQILYADKPYIYAGLTTFTFTAPAAAIYTVVFKATVNAAAAEGYGAGSGQGYGAGAGGGFIGFVGGAFGPGFGNAGYGFGPSDGYAHSLPDEKVPTSVPEVFSGLAVLVKKNGGLVETAPTLGVAQSSLEFTFKVQCAQGDTIDVIPSGDESAKITVAINKGL